MQIGIRDTATFPHDHTSGDTGGALGSVFAHDHTAGDKGGTIGAGSVPVGALVDGAVDTAGRLAAGIITEGKIASAGCDKGNLKTSTSSATGDIPVSSAVYHQHQDYCFQYSIYMANSQYGRVTGYNVNNADSAARIGLRNDSGGVTIAYRLGYRYVTASDRPFIFALIDKQTGVVAHALISDDPPPKYWGMKKPPLDFVWPILPDNPENYEPLISFDVPGDIMKEIRGKSVKDKRLEHQILEADFVWDPDSALFVPK